MLFVPAAIDGQLVCDLGADISPILCTKCNYINLSQIYVIFMSPVYLLHICTKAFGNQIRL